LGFVGIVVLFFIIWGIAKAAKGATGGGYDGLVAKGIPARGVLIQVDRFATPVEATGFSLRRFERRGMVIDVEIPGQPPYELTASPYIPKNLSRDVLPGCTVELRVHPRVGFAMLPPSQEPR
jgi:hypothetical protein